MNRRYPRVSLLRAAIVVLGLSVWATPALATDQVITLVRDRALAGCAPSPMALIEQSYILIEAAGPASAKAVLLLFAGGNGQLEIADHQLDINSNNFLVRSRQFFAARGFHVAVMDAATDFLTCPAGLRGQRTSATYTSDMQAVIDDLRGRYPGKPLWVIGTSRGATAAAQAGAAIVPPPNGVVLSAPVTVLSTPSVFDVSLPLITSPTLIVVHEDDGCSVTPPSGAAVLAAALTSAAKVKTREVSGGFPALDPNPCNALTPHGFIGLEVKVVQKITDWISP